MSSGTSTAATHDHAGTTVDVTAVYADAMAELEATLDLIERHGPALIRRCLEADTHGGRTWGRRPVELPVLAAHLVREIASDAIVRTLEQAA